MFQIKRVILNFTMLALAAAAAHAQTVEVSSHDCGDAPVGGSPKTCNADVIVTARGSTVQLPAQPYALSGMSGDFTVGASPNGSCSNRTLTDGESCYLLRVQQFAPADYGVRTMTVTVTPVSGSAGSGTVSGTGRYGSLQITPSSVPACPSTAYVGVPASCAPMTVKATQAPVVLGDPLYTVQADPQHVVTHTPATENACAPGRYLAVGETCTWVTFPSRPAETPVETCTSMSRSPMVVTALTRPV